MVKRTPELVNPPFCLFFVCIVHGFFVIRNFNLIPTGKSSHFQGQTSLEQTSKLAHFHGEMSPRAGKSLFLPIFHLLSQLVPTGKPAHFKGQTRPKAGKLASCRFFVCYKPWIFGDLEFQRDFC
ncbi:hypothetical protein H5410_042204 [Solanum commersonii]|uniref:Uncharacterized protein n=1 Tax=Solanum commersonii TaxID=4109 RepID=A0A9J5XVB7_SOLCO|nr:hypothetical protein H5410_042204 [Solanum commersonii]